MRLAVPPEAVVVPVMLYEPGSLTVPPAKLTEPAPAMPEVEAMLNVPPPKARVGARIAVSSPLPPIVPPPLSSRVPDSTTRVPAPLWLNATAPPLPL